MSAETPPAVPHPDLARYYPRAADRRRFVSRLFDRTARHYDGIEGALSLGSGAFYRREAIRRAGIGPGMRVLDAATGTGLTARGLQRAVGKEGRVWGLDASFGMLAEERRRLPITSVQALAEELPLADAAVDALTMGYALRHVADLDAAFREYHRVLRPGGLLLLLELTAPPQGTFRRSLFGFYMGRILPALGRLFGGAATATLMRYYWDTIDACLPPEAILAALARAGFDSPRRATYRVSILSEYRARKPG